MDYVLERLSRLQRILLETTGLEAFLHDLTELAADVVIPPASTGITLIRDGEPTTVVTSDQLAGQLDEIQYAAGDGPCLHSIRIAARVECPNIGVEERWSGWRERAVEAGIRSALAIPLFIDGDTVGALNLYGYRAWTFTPSEVQRVEVFAGQASGALTLLRRQMRREQDIRNLEEALASRSMLDRALGILMVQKQCDHETAMNILRTQSRSTNRTVNSVAAEVVADVQALAEGAPDAVEPDVPRD